MHAVRVSGLLGIGAVQYGRGDLCVLLGLLVYIHVPELGVYDECVMLARESVYVWFRRSTSLMICVVGVFCVSGLLVKYVPVFGVLCIYVMLARERSCVSLHAVCQFRRSSSLMICVAEVL